MGKQRNYTYSIHPRIRFAVFDRRFYIAELIDYLEANKIGFIILVSEKKGRIKDMFKKQNNWANLSIR
jgi:hypothetical protein